MLLILLDLITVKTTHVCYWTWVADMEWLHKREIFVIHTRTQLHKLLSFNSTLCPFPFQKKQEDSQSHLVETRIRQFYMVYGLMLCFQGIKILEVNRRLLSRWWLTCSKDVQYWSIQCVFTTMLRSYNWKCLISYCI